MTDLTHVLNNVEYNSYITCYMDNTNVSTSSDNYPDLQKNSKVLILRTSEWFANVKYNADKTIFFKTIYKEFERRSLFHYLILIFGCS